MQNDTFEADVRSADEQGHDVQEMVRQLTLRRISARSMDIESLRQIAHSVIKGAKAAVHNELNLSAAQTESARMQLKQAVAGLDMALAQMTGAARLAIEEAAGRAQQFTSEDLTLARANLESLDELVIETLQSSASSARDAADEILHQLAEHTRTHGTLVGAQIKETLSVITHQLSLVGRTQAASGLHLAQATSDLLRQIAAGVLTGIADHVKPSHND